jgi:anaerobic magnesium-protoporphyrin IX monomethyl ester cyclase
MSARSRVRVVLVHPPLRRVVGAATPEYVDENRGFTPPMGLLYLQAALEQSRHESVFVDAHLEGWDYAEAARQILTHEPDLVGLQALTFTLPDAYLQAKALKQQNPDVPILIGGPHPTIYPLETVGLSGVDFAFVGEGERALVQFLDAFDDPAARIHVPGIVSKLDGQVRLAPGAGLLEDLDGIPFPARRSSLYKRYSSVLAERSSITVMITSRGCPFNCIFCNRMGRRYRWHSAPYVLAEFEQINELGIGEVFIHDDTFSIRRDRVVAICEGLIERRLDIIWEARTRVDCVDEQLIALMRRAGCHRLSFGVESGSPKVLKRMRKDINPQRVEQVFGWCRREGIVTLADFMLGNLDETEDDVRMSLELMRRIDPDYVQFSMLSPYPATPLYELGLESGLIKSDIWREFARDPLQPFRGPLWTQNFTEEELTHLTAAAYRSFYMRPRFVWKQLRRVRSFGQLRTMARGALGMLSK